MNKLIFSIALILFCSICYSQSFTVRDSILYVNGEPGEADFAKNTYLDAINDGSLVWEIVSDSMPLGWDFSNCFPDCYSIGVTTGNLNFSQGSSYYLNGHFYPNNISGEGKVTMKLNDGNGTIEYVTWHGFAGSVGIIDQHIRKHKSQVKNIYNLNGQLVNEINTNQLYIYEFYDGSFVKYFILDK